MVVAVVVRIGGVTAAEVLTRRVRFHRARAAGWTQLSAGVLTDHPRGHDLPGLLAPVVPLDVDDGRGGRHALLWDRRTGTLSAVLRCSPIGVDLADPGQVDAWIAGWGALLADLGYQPLVTHIAVTVDTTPTGGTTVRDHVAAALDPHAPTLARRVLEELAAVNPATASAWQGQTVRLRLAQTDNQGPLRAAVDNIRFQRIGGHTDGRVEFLVTDKPSSAVGLVLHRMSEADAVAALAERAEQRARADQFAGAVLVARSQQGLGVDPADAPVVVPARRTPGVCRVGRCSGSGLKVRPESAMGSVTAVLSSAPGVAGRAW